MKTQTLTNIVLLFTLVVLFQAPKQVFAQMQTKSNEVVTRIGNPRCDISNTTGAGNVSLSTLPGVSSAYILYSNNQSLSNNETKQIPAYSVIKLWVAAAVYNAREKGTLNLTDTYTVEEKDKVGGTGILAYGSLPQTLSYAKLVELMLTVSDNVATNILIKRLGGLTPVNEYIQQAGYQQTILERYIGDTANQEKDNKTSAKDAATFMSNLLKKQVVNQDASDQILALLKKRTQEEKREFFYISRKLPAAAGFIGKSGVGVTPIIRNDVGTFLDKNGQRVFMGVFLSGLSSGQSGEEAIANLAEQVYNQSTPTLCPAQGFNRVFYCQGDPRWENGCGLANAGCGPTSMAMILSSFGDTITPKDMDGVFRTRGWRGCGSNSESSMTTAIRTYLPEKGYTQIALPLSGGQLDLQKAKEYLSNGYLIIGSTPNHIFVLYDVNIANNTVTLMDPGRCENKDGVIRPNRAPWNGEGWYYVYAVKKR